MIATWQLELAMQIALAAIPVAVYFLILGLLNSQNRPQLLSARFDFTLLMAALSPLCVVPVLRAIGPSLWTVAAAVAAVAAAIAVLTPGRKGWVIYNISRKQALQTITHALASADIPGERRGERIELADGGVIRISTFPLLRNVTVTLENGGRVDPSRIARFEAALAAGLGRIEAVAHPMAVTLVLISTAVIVAPLALMADRMPEMVRLLSDLIG